ncbi:hypothetical protein J4711_14850 [Staphylococcus epidermidis]|nr:hypothetical protein [Staphylococcus epidermidis]
MMRLTFDSEGATLKHSELIKYTDTVDEKAHAGVFEENALCIWVRQV